ncbi:hypothetical protein BDL97_01G029000 [Sphagnum fallax]|nr:hypothetical protein BDL97_01G029000 [Sphagnum fallax]
MERNKKTKRRVTNEEEEGASNSSSSRESSDRPPSPFERICCCNNGGGARWNEGAEPQGRCSRRRDARALADRGLLNDDDDRRRRRREPDLSLCTFPTIGRRRRRRRSRVFCATGASGDKQRYPHESLIVYKSAIRSKRILDESYASSLLLACICAALCPLHQEVLANSCGHEVKLVHGQKEPGSSKLQPILCSLMKPPSRYLHL